MNETEPRRSRSKLLIGVAVLALVAAASVAGVFLLRDDEDKGPSYPAKWAPQVLPFVEIVEEQRDLEFKHPVHVEFLSDKEFRKEVTSDEEELTKEDKKEIKQFEGWFRALGLIEGDVDLFEAFNDLSSSSIVGLYDHEDKRIRMRGKTLTPTSKATLVHELTHVLQDQHFDLAKRMERLEDDEESAAYGGFEAIVEGDASRIESLYTEDLSKKELAELEKAQEAEAEAAEKEADEKEVPGILSTFMSAPYALGEAMLDLAVLLDGNDAVDALFKKPPTTEEHLLDPWTLLEDNEKQSKVAKPKLEKDEKEFDKGPFGAFGWLVVLAERIPLLQALDAADGWGGDAYVAFERDELSCVRAHYEGDTDEDTEEMHAALTAWVAGLPDGPASVEADGDLLVFESCDPGTGADVGTDSSEAALGLAITRTYVAWGVLDEGADEELSRCYADGIVHSFPLERLNDPEWEPNAGAQRKFEELAEACVG